jgi:glutathione S-transferase
MIKLYGGKMNRGGRCMLALEECGLAYEVCDLDLQKGEQKSAEFLALNPNGTVPTLVDGKTVVWESIAINLYLAEKYGKGLMPTSPEDRGHVYQWSVWAIATLEPHLAAVFRNRFMLPENERDEAAAQAGAIKAAEYMDILDGSLKGKEHLVGNHFTIADLNVAHMVAWANMIGVDLSSRPNILRWFGAIAARPAFAKLMG